MNAEIPDDIWWHIHRISAALTIQRVWQRRATRILALRQAVCLEATPEILVSMCYRMLHVLVYDAEWWADAVGGVGQRMWRDSYQRRQAAYLWDFVDDEVDLQYDDLSRTLGCIDMWTLDDINLMCE